MLISETGPSLDVISVLYTIEGLLQAVIVVIIMPWLDTNMFWKFFLSTWIILMGPPLAICALGKIHWVFYLVTLLLVDVAMTVATGLLSVLLLRSIAWEHISTFHKQVSTLAGFTIGASYVQMPLKSGVGSWEAASLIGHGAIALLLLLVYATHRNAMRKFWDDLAEPIQRGENGDMEEEDLSELEEIDEEELGEDPPSLVRMTEHERKTADANLPGLLE
ncbi:unnamed protein product [Symbiodinium natans]|uniref:Uncharacterized protein n=1 Tax=Symbiodinium natans TaxID=878477 RepID=A0A812V5V3_9DINO|nr:unnamed protein product [Symbiodinium natans]